MENRLRLRPHHLPEIYAYMFYGSKEEFNRARRVYRKLYENGFMDNIVDLMEKFWKGHFTKLEVTIAEDDFCRACEDLNCKGRNLPDKYPKGDPNKIFWLTPGLYDAEKIKAMMREIYKKEMGKDPPELK